ncbi:MAG TPA: hypothetical protein PLR02_12080 [Rhodocyclaceae bacterium]|nr:hypothetical protein [Rhodocyclaceae bacterium]
MQSSDDAPPPVGEIGRCTTCNRWGGRRRVGEDGHTVLLDPTRPRGPCVRGPWHGSLRGPRNACGYWLIWAKLEPAGPPASS